MEDSALGCLLNDFCNAGFCVNHSLGTALSRAGSGFLYCVDPFQHPGEAAGAATDLIGGALVGTTASYATGGLGIGVCTLVYGLLTP